MSAAVVFFFHKEPIGGKEPALGAVDALLARTYFTVIARWLSGAVELIRERLGPHHTAAALSTAA